MDTQSQGQTNSLSLRLSRDGHSIVVTESHNRVGGVFGDLSSAMRFARAEAANRGCKLDLHYDASLAMIRAAG